MFSARRIYVYLVSLISFAAVVFAVISLLQNLLLPNYYRGGGDLAFQIAVLIIATPIYLGHWFWQQRKVAQDEVERGVLIRRIYLYVVIGGAVAVVAFNVYDLLEALLGINVSVGRSSRNPLWHSVVYYLIPVVIAAGAWFYHVRLLQEDQREYPDTDARGAVRRLYIYLFAAAGLTMVSLASIDIVRWLLSTLGDLLLDMGTLGGELLWVVPQIVVGLTLWLAYWIRAQRLYRSGDAEERESVLRKFYLYAVIFVGVAGGVTTAAMLLSGIFQTLLGLSPDGDIREPLSMIIVFVALWFYHSQVLADDARASKHTEQQAEIRRIYLYLLSGIGLVALMVGLTGDISTLLYVVDEGMSDLYRELLSYFSAALIAGLPVWILAWRKAQQEASRIDKTGSQARDSLVRKIYLYFFLFVSIMAVLGSAVYVIYRILQWFLSGESLTLIDIAIPLTIAVVQLLVWFYHLATLRGDRRLSVQDEVRQLADIRLVLIDNGDATTIQAIADRLRKAAPGLAVQPLHAGAMAETAETDDERHQGVMTQVEQIEQIEQAEVIVAPWTLFMPGGDAAAPSLATAVANSPAHKIVLPEAEPTWHWVGMESLPAEKTADETLDMMKQIMAGEEIRNRRRWGCGAIALTIVGALLLIWAIIALLSLIMYGF